MTSQKPDAFDAPDDCFLCTKSEILQLLGQSEFYAVCPEFSGLRPAAETLARYVASRGGPRGCRGCAAWRIRRAQWQLVQVFTEVFLSLQQAGKVEALRRLGRFGEKKSGRRFAGVALACRETGKGKHRRTVVEAFTPLSEDRTEQPNQTRKPDDSG